MKFKPIHAVPFVFSTVVLAANVADKPDFTQADEDEAPVGMEASRLIVQAMESTEQADV